MELWKVFAFITFLEIEKNSEKNISLRIYDNTVASPTSRTFIPSEWNEMMERIVPKTSNITFMIASFFKHLVQELRHPSTGPSHFIKLRQNSKFVKAWKLS